MATDRTRTITLTTDFGLADPYVAAMKGVILSISPDARIIDVSHDIRPQRIVQALFVTQAVWPYVPESAVHVVVVDPGVGTDRRALALETPRDVVMGPDNGVLSSALPDALRPATAGAIELPAGYRAYEITERRYLREPVSATFHGRDIFAPAAAHVSMGLAPGELGPAVGSIVAWPPLRAARAEGGVLRASVIHVDRFGNVVTDARAEDVPAGDVRIEIAARRIEGLMRTYAGGDGLIALVGSAGYVEIALPGGSAAAELGVDIGERVIVRPLP